MFDHSIITLNEESVKNNIKFLRKKLGNTIKISAVVKANAYGHGIEQIIPIFEKNGIDHYAVFYYSEAIRVYNCITKPSTIMVMGYLCDESIRDAILKEIEFFVFNIERLNLAIKYAKELNLKAKIHLEAETGMNRSGLNIEELNMAINIIKENKAFIEISGFCTHLAGAESVSNHLRIQNQLKKYKKMLTILEVNNLNPTYKHVANSAAAIVYPKTKMDLVRVGIMLYGFWSSSEVFIHYLNAHQDKLDPLKRVLRWNSQIMAIKEVKSGEFVGYGISYQAQKNITTALVPIGYSLGYNRSLSNKGYVLIQGCRCSVIGVVNMNMIIIDVSNVNDPKVGDEVVLIGKQADLEIKVSAFSELSDELNYEILAHLPESIIRTVKNQ
ncbi:MAG: alanine racemase [Flavobacteriaceae bacterium]|nr:alanine racemase [Flavobacteriaceae bacterium]